MIKPSLCLFGLICSVLYSSSSQSLTDQSGSYDDEIDQFQLLLRPFLQERVSGTEGNLRVQEHIWRELSSLGWYLERDRFVDSTPLGDKQFTNIVATLDPKSTSRLSLACHFDSKKFDDFVFIGATDSAVPCALLLDLAHHLNASLWSSVNRVNTKTLQLIFFDGEEAFVEWSETDSLYGSRHLAEQMEKWHITADDSTSISAINAMSAMVLLDLIGTPDCHFWNWFPKTSQLYQKLQEIEMRLTEAGLLETTTFNSKSINSYFPDKSIPKMMRSGISDDHVPFMRRNVSILHLISYPFPGVWHKATDNEDSLSYPAIINLSRVLRVFLVDYFNLQ